MMRDMRQEEIAALKGLVKGNLEPLADLLELGFDDFHPHLQRKLRNMIRGSKADSDFRLSAERHPQLKQPAQGYEAKRRRDIESMMVAEVMFRHGALNAGCYESAMRDTITELHLSKSTIDKHWAANKKYFPR